VLVLDAPQFVQRAAQLVRGWHLAHCLGSTFLSTQVISVCLSLKYSIWARTFSRFPAIGLPVNLGPRSFLYVCRCIISTLLLRFRSRSPRGWGCRTRQSCGCSCLFKSAGHKVFLFCLRLDGIAKLLETFLILGDWTGRD
jgi:hypothetical protein